MIANIVPLFYAIRIVSLFLCLAIALLALRKCSDSVLNKLISCSFVLFATGYSIEAVNFMVSSELQENASFMMALIVLVITTSIYLLF